MLLSMKATFKKIIDSQCYFLDHCGLFILSLTFVVQVRAGKDLKVGLYGVAQVSEKKSPYDNPLDPPKAFIPLCAWLCYPAKPLFLKERSDNSAV